MNEHFDLCFHHKADHVRCFAVAWQNAVLSTMITSFVLQSLHGLSDSHVCLQIQQGRAKQASHPLWGANVRVIGCWRAVSTRLPASSSDTTARPKLPCALFMKWRTAQNRSQCTKLCRACWQKAAQLSVPASHATQGSPPPTCTYT